LRWIGKLLSKLIRFDIHVIPFHLFLIHLISSTMAKNYQRTAEISRRDFIKVSALASVSLPIIHTTAFGNLAHSVSGSRVRPEWRNRQSGMAYRQLGRTGYMVSEVVNGGDPVSSTHYRQVELAIEMGLNYLDTAPAYGRGESEKGYGKVIDSSSKREKVFINTKISSFTGVRNRMYREIFDGLPSGKQEKVLKKAAEMRLERGVDKPGYFFIYWPGQEQSMDPSYLSNAMMADYGHLVDGSTKFRETIDKSLEESMKRVGTDYFDLVMCPHGANCPEEVNVPEVFEIFADLKKQGKTRYLGVSSHNDPAGVLKAAAATGKYDVAMIAYNVANDGYLEDAIRQAHDSGMGVIAMKVAMAVATQHEELRPLPAWRGEKLNQLIPGDDMKLPVKAYLWALQNPRLSAVISNMWDEQYVRENLSVAGKKVDFNRG
jgi:aryl-alcohol dehydrogenase-like predicted oxidoreductase